MKTVYLWDENNIYFASREVDESGDLPARCTFTVPPELTGEQVARWTGAGWELLDSRPEIVSPAIPVEKVTGERDYFLATAAIRIAPLQDAVDLDDATDEEIALLKKWKQYRVALNRIDTANPTWPEQPE